MNTTFHNETVPEPNPEITDGIGLFGGTAGELLYAAYLHKITGNQIFEDQVDEHFETLLSDLNNAENVLPDFFTYCSGLAGIGVLIHWLNEHYTPVDTDELDEMIVPLLASQLDALISKKNYDFLHGYVGYGFYFLRAKGGEKYVEKILEELQLSAIQNGDQLYWEETGFLGEDAKPVERRRENWSLSHGMSSILMFLCDVYVKGIRKEETATLCHGVVNYFKEHTRSDRGFGYTFPALIDGEERGSRISWCYGEIGTSLALIRYGNTFHDQQIVDLATTVLKFNAQKRGMKENNQHDTCLCHGSAGLATIFRRLYLDTTEKLFEEAADYWYKETVSCRKPEISSSGYLYFSGTEKKMTENDSLLSGSLGTQLLLKTVELNADQSWDTLFLLS